MWQPIIVFCQLHDARVDAGRTWYTAGSCVCSRNCRRFGHKGNASKFVSIIRRPSISTFVHLPAIANSTGARSHLGSFVHADFNVYCDIYHHWYHLRHVPRAAFRGRRNSIVPGYNLLCDWNPFQCRSPVSRLSTNASINRADGILFAARLAESRVHTSCTTRTCSFTCMEKTLVP